MKVKCPICHKIIEWENSPYRPFCSYRCKLIDLGAWADGDYSIEGEPVQPDQIDTKETLPDIDDEN